MNKLMISALIAVASLIGCSGDDPAAPDASPPDQGRADHSTTPPPSDKGTPLPSLEISPTSIKSYVGGTALFLVQVPQASSNIQITTVPPSSFDTWPATFVGPGVLELILRPEEKHLGLEFRAEVSILAGAQLFGTAVVETVDWTPPAPVDDLRDAFVAHLEDNEPELGITAATTWQWWGNSPDEPMIENHLYLSDTWEMNIAVTKLVPPKDKVEVYLRRRGELAPSWAARMTSLTDDPTITEVTPPSSVIR